MAPKPLTFILGGARSGKSDYAARIAASLRSPVVVTGEARGRRQRPHDRGQQRGGMGVVPASVLGRLFQDALGRANQLLAASADNVVLCVAGIPTIVKGTDPLMATP